jgi:hypothetical protein
MIEGNVSSDPATSIPAFSQVKSPVIAAIFFLLIFLGIASLVINQYSLKLDKALRSVVQEHYSTTIATCMRQVSLFGSRQLLAPMTLLLIVVLVWSKDRDHAILLALVMAGEIVLESSLKIAFHRLRPQPFLQVLLFHTYAFPSGHAMASLCFYVTISFIVMSYLRAKWMRILPVVMFCTFDCFGWVVANLFGSALSHGCAWRLRGSICMDLLCYSHFADAYSAEKSREILVLRISRPGL